MATPDDVRKLAELARIEVPESELAKFAAEFESILAYVGQLDTLSITESGELLPYRNVMRDDGEPHAPGLHTEKLAAQFPEREGDALKVKQIISHD